MVCRHYLNCQEGKNAGFIVDSFPIKYLEHIKIAIFNTQDIIIVFGAKLNTFVINNITSKPFNTMPLDEDTTRYTAPPDDKRDPMEYQSAHIIHYIYKSIPDHDRDYEIHEVIEILEYALKYIKDEDIGIDTI